LSLVLAGDVGGTKTLLGLFDAGAERPRAVAVRQYRTAEFADLPAMIASFLDGEAQTADRVDAAAFGVAGPVDGDAAALTNAAWRVAARPVAERFGIPRVRLVNDLVAMALALPVLDASELRVLQEGEGRRDGNVALIAPGTGLGEALLHYVDGRFIPSPSEGGNADFAARTDREIAMLRDLTARFGRARVEQVISGPGLVNIHRVLHKSDTCVVGSALDGPDGPAAISRAALTQACGRCAEVLEMWVEALGAEAGNLALRTVSTGGLFVGGGIVPNVLAALMSGSFLRAFRSKAPLEAMLDRMPVKVITNPEAGLLGAAVAARAHG
jgi:glucokinase